MGSIATNPRTGNPWKPDDSVFRGEQIGSVGDYPYLSGNAFHLHFEIRKQRLHSAGSFPCSKPDAYVRARYTEPSAFIALNRPSAPPGAGDGVPWPMFGHDAQHTSQTPLLGPVPADLTWSFDAGQELGEPPVVGTDGTVYLAGRFSLWALSSTGEQQWAIPAGFINASPALSPAGSTLYVNDFVDGLRAHSVADGSTLWTRRLGSLCSGPTVDSEGTIYIGSCSGVLYGLDPDGSTRFATRVSNTGDPNADAIHAYPTQSNGGLTYVVTRGGRVFAVDSVGDLVRQYPSSGSLGEVLSTPAIGSTGELYVPIWAGVARVVAVSASGEEQWRLAHNPETVEQVGFAIAHDGTLLVQAGEDVMAVDPGTGLVLWEQKGLAAVSGGISIGGDGTIYVSGKDGDMVLLGPNGSTMSAGSGGCFAQGPPVIGIDRSAFVFESSSCGDFLHAFTGSS
ncbi:MAG: PQQ-binding-like beta-propeller repeat protein [Acidimicrobiia bacterium]